MIIENKMDFALERIRTLKPDQLSKEFLLEIAWLYDRIVKTGSKVPVVDLAFELVWPIDFVGECVRNAIDLGCRRVINRYPMRYLWALK